MVTAFFLGVGLLAASPSPLPSPAVLAAYEAANAKTGRNPDAHVKLALWCEAHGLQDQRARHLQLALAADPSHAAARGLTGLVDYRGQWKPLDEIAADTRSDKELQASLAEYNARREGMAETADAHWNLALWCDENGLKPEAQAHFTAVTRLAPGRSDAWTRLGCRKYHGRWLTDAQIDAELAEATAQELADARWAPRFKEWWGEWLANKDRRGVAEAAIGETLEARAVPTIRRLFVGGTPEQQLVAVTLFNQIDSADSTRELAHLAALARSDDVRKDAVEALSRRDPNEVVEPLIALMHERLGVRVSGGRGPNAVAELRVEDERAILQKTYIQQNVRASRTPLGPAFGFIAPVVPPRSRRTANEQLSRDLRAVAQRNASREAVNESVHNVLVDLTGQDQGADPKAWRQWLADQRGYSYAPSTTPKQVIRRVSRHAQVQFTSAGFHSYCFGQGTLVRTMLGTQPIETLRVGDRVLAEDPATGALSFQPIIVAYHNPPSPTLRIRFDREEIVSTPIHRFWGAGKGWILARDLKPGDTVRVVAGVAQVTAVESDEVQPVFNLELAEGHTFFVGQQGAMVHDNSRAQPVSSPFDAPLALSAEPGRETR